MKALCKWSAMAWSRGSTWLRRGTCSLENQAGELKRQAQEKRSAMAGIVRSRDMFCEALLEKEIIWVRSICEGCGDAGE
ncbi:hypothetical protein CDL15_Pgr005183 [Punica granatum]|nr:hypothetical protein CDL15_Pgr005183 [Punica granatum]